jgi:Virus neck protein.
MRHHLVTPITINEEEVVFHDTTFLRLVRPYTNFDKYKLHAVYITNPNIPISIPEHSSYNFKIGYSIDGFNYSDHVYFDDFEIPPELEGVSLFISFLFEKQPINSLNSTPSDLHYDLNVIPEIFQATLKSLKYNNRRIRLNDLHQVKYLTYQDLINQYPNWNLYDNQEITIWNWIAQCNSVVEMYGHKCVYFKTSPTQTNNTLRQHYLRNVVSIKKLMVMFPGNEIGSADKIVYQDWDLPLSDDFMAHIVWDKFKIAFGEDAIPNERDYIYIPLLNKLFTLGVCQPVNKFMGKIAWWEVQLFKYEEDAHVGISKSLMDEVNTIPEFEKALDLLGAGELLDLDGISTVEPLQSSNVVDKVEEHINRNLNTKEKIGEKTIFEKRTATDSYSNVLEDSTWYVSMKETEKVRQFYHNRLKINQVNPGFELYPINMYNCCDVGPDIMVMRYKLSDFTEVSKVSTLVNDSFDVEFIYARTSKFNGPLIDFIHCRQILFYISMNRLGQLFINEDPTDFKFELNELYLVKLSYNKQYPQIVVNIHTYTDNKSQLVYQTIFPSDIKFKEFDFVNIYGGDYVIGKIKIDINNKNIFTDNCNPLLVMNRITMI